MKRKPRIEFGKFRRDYRELDPISENYWVAYYQEGELPLACYPKPLSFIIEHFAIDSGYKGSRKYSHGALEAKYCPVCRMGSEYKEFMKKLNGHVMEIEKELGR